MIERTSNCTMRTAAVRAGIIEHLHKDVASVWFPKQRPLSDIQFELIASHRDQSSLWFCRLFCIPCGSSIRFTARLFLVAGFLSPRIRGRNCGLISRDFLLSVKTRKV